MLAQLQDAYIGAVEKAAASTVSVSTARGPYGPPFGPYPRRGMGSGVVFDAQGHVLTTHHVVDGVEKVIVAFPDGRVLSGTVVGGDEETDIAIVRVSGSDFRPADLADSDGLRVGQPVLAIGNPLGLPGGPTVTSGVVSSLRRSLARGPGDGVRVIQTDAAVNPGNSGGPLIDLQGRVVAINSATIPFAEGIGFSIPINAAREVARQIIEHGHVQRPWLGIAGYDVDRRIAAYYGLTVHRGVFLAEVTPGSPADAAGLQVGDVLTSLGGRPLVGLVDLIESLRVRKISDAVEVETERRGRTVRATAVLGTRPF